MNNESKNNYSERYSVSEAKDNADHDCGESSTDATASKLDSRKLKSIEGHEAAGRGDLSEIGADDDNNDRKPSPGEQPKGKSKEEFWFQAEVPCHRSTLTLF